jgi:CBS domain-containing protein
VSSVLVVDGLGRIAGILTEQDVTRRIVFQRSADQPVETAMTRPVITVGPDEYLYRAIGRMRREGLRHMPVIDNEARPVGTLDLHEAMAAATATMTAQIDRLTRDASIDGMAQVKQAQAELARDLLADNLPAPDIQGLVTEINHDIHRRVLDGARRAMEEEGWGAPPMPFTLLVMGSGGRGENFLFPDQDNGFIVADYPDDDHNRIDAYFIKLAERFTHDLDRVGFPLCKGNVMASNPLWRKTETQWRDQIELWAMHSSPVAVLFADIFFDFHPVDGAPEPAERLRRFVTDALRTHPRLLMSMGRDETGRSVALGLFGRILTDSHGGHPGRVDLKMRGTMPLVASIRLWALKHGVAETGTLARLSALAADGVVGVNDADELAHAFNHVTFVLLRQQLADFHAGRRVGNLVEPRALSRHDRQHLVAALRAIDRFRKLTRAAFTGEAW